MADHHSTEGASSSDVRGESSESTVELNIKTLDSQIYSFHVNKNMPVSLFKEKIASKIGLPVGQQRLIFRGKVLKDEHLLSEYHVESGHTLHLVARQPSQSPSSSNTSSGDLNTNNGRGQDASAGGPRIRGGPISHSVVLGTLNVGDQGEGIMPDLNRVIGAVLNSFGVGNLTTNGGIGITQPNVQAPQGNEAEGTRSNVGMQNQAGSQAQAGQAFPSQPQVLQIPLGAAISIPSLNSPIPDSLSTLSEFISRMEQVLSQNGYLPTQPPSNGDLPSVQLPTDTSGFSTPLSTVLRQAQRLLSGHAVAALSHIAGRLEQEMGSTDNTVRNQIQTESMQVGLAVQHLGALLLELGRTMLTLRMGNSPGESYVNAGPAVYISPSGPNPIMVQPFPLQASSLFGGSAAAPSIGTAGPVGIGNPPRHVNIHIHTAVGTRVTNGEGVHGERANGPGSGDSGQTRVLPVRNVIATAVPPGPPVSVSSASQSGVSVTQPLPDSAALSTVFADLNSRIRNFVDNVRSENQTPSGQSESSTVQNQERILPVNGAGESPSLPGDVHGRDEQKTQPQLQSSNSEDTVGVVNSEEVVSSIPIAGSHDCSGVETTIKTADDSVSAPRSGQGNDNSEGATAIPLGLGLGGLQPKRRSRQPKSQAMSSDGGTSSQNQQTRTNEQQVLQSLASLANRTNGNTTLSSRQLAPSAPLEVQGSDCQLDVASAMSQVLHAPALNGLLAGVSQQTGIGSPDVLRNMLEQFTQSPGMMNTVNQIAQQVDTQDLGNMFSGLGRGQGGGFDLSRMVQQMMPIVSQALGGAAIAQSRPTEGPEPPYNERSSRDLNTNGQNSQIDLQQVAQRIHQQNPPEHIFRSMVESAVRLYDSGTNMEDLFDELCLEEGLASEFMETLRLDICRRLQGES